MGFHVGQTFGDYSITALLGAGGMGHVYKVEHRLTRRTEAMKVLAAELATETQIKRFEREMQVLARLSHPNIAVLHNALHSENQLILLMEFVEGRTLESILSAGRLPIRTGVEYIRQILIALQYAHQQGVVHRDVTPSNVIITAVGEVKLTDFGLSKSFGDPLLTRGGEILGTLPYMAPEQVKRTTEPDGRSDLFSVGTILYEVLTGRKPFGADRRLAPVLTDTESQPQPPTQLEPGLSRRWDEIVQRALARDPARRYQSAAEFLQAIAQTEPAPGVEQARPYMRILRGGIAISAGLALALVAWPAVDRFRPVAPPAVSLQVLHVAPPEFAFPVEPSSAGVDPATTPSVTESTHEQRADRAADHAGTVAAIEPEASVSETSPHMKRKFWSKLNPFRKKKSLDLKE